MPETRRRGRPTVVTVEAIEKITALLRVGTPLSTALTAAGISRRTFQRWSARTDPAARRFQQAVEQARAEAEVLDVALIAQAANRDWKAAAAILEREWPERWAGAGGDNPLDDLLGEPPVGDWSP